MAYKYEPDTPPLFDSDKSKHREPHVRPLNINTFLITLVLGIAAWNLKETVQQGRDFSRLEERTAGLMRDTNEYRTRLAAVELQMMQFKLDLATASRRNGP